MARSFHTLLFCALIACHAADSAGDMDTCQNGKADSCAAPQSHVNSPDDEMSLIQAQLQVQRRKKLAKAANGMDKTEQPKKPGSGTDYSPACGSMTDWDAGYGPCSTYALADGVNHAYCEHDHDTSNGLFASEVCLECGCTSTKAPPTEPEAPPPPDTKVCIIDYDWDAGYGPCKTYSKEFGSNHDFCESDMSNGFTASMVCTECGECSASGPEIDCVPISAWDAGYGSCATYAYEPNHGYCTDMHDGISANEACPECGACIGASPPSPEGPKPFESPPSLDKLVKAVLKFLAPIFQKVFGGDPVKEAAVEAGVENTVEEAVEKAEVVIEKAKENPEQVKEAEEFAEAVAEKLVPKVKEEIASHMETSLSQDGRAFKHANAPHRTPRHAATPGRAPHHASTAQRRPRPAAMPQRGRASPHASTAQRTPHPAAMPQRGRASKHTRQRAASHPTHPTAPMAKVQQP